jgi:hypothetical protein
VLRAGELRSDVGIYREGAGHSVAGLAGSPYLTDQSLAEAGYTYGFLNETMLTDDSTDVEGGVFDADGPAYRAMVYNGTANRENYSSMSLASAERLDELAASGLPVIVVGATPTRVTGYAPADDAKLQAVFARLLERDTVTHVATEAELPGALRELGVAPASAFGEPAALQPLHRETEDVDYYYLWNSAAERTTTSVTLAGTGRPYALDAWTGEVTPVADFTRVDAGHVRVDVDLASADSTIIAVSERDLGGEPADAAPSAEETTTQGLPDWTLAVTSYQAGATPLETAHVAIPSLTVPSDAGRLTAWKDIPALRSVSGVGTYRTTFTVPDGWTADSWATLDLGTVLGTYTVRVNGVELPPHSQLDTSSIDVTGHLEAGENVIEVEVATLLANAARGTSDAYGLVGPVSVTLENASPALEITTTPRMLGGKVHLSVAVANNTDSVLDIVVTTPFGNKTFKNVAPGKSKAVAANSRSAAIAAGEVSVTATGDGIDPMTQTAGYPAFGAE